MGIFERGLLSDTPHVPVYAGDLIVGTAYDTEKGWAARMQDGTPLGFHAALLDAQAAILARHHAPGHHQSADCPLHHE
jgi:hypothetical protein